MELRDPLEKMLYLSNNNLSSFLFTGSSLPPITNAFCVKAFNYCSLARLDLIPCDALLAMLFVSNMSASEICKL